MKKVNESALFGRINRKLAHEKKVLKKCRENSQWYDNLGDYYIVDLFNNTLCAQHVNIESLSRELGVLDENEQVAA